MIKFLLVFALVGGCFASLPGTNCLKNLAEGYQAIQETVPMELSSQKIDAFTNIIHEIPETLGLCLGDSLQSKFNAQWPPACIVDLNKAAKIGVRLMNQKDNQLLATKDLILLERHWQTKVKKSCPMLTEVTLQDVKDKAKCLEDSYRLSLVVQKLGGDINKADKKAIINDVNTIFTDLPTVLDTCGKSDWANEVRKYLPMNCVHALEDFVAELAFAEHHYTHFEWLIKNYKEIEVYFSMVRMHCPFAFKI